MALRANTGAIRTQEGIAALWSDFLAYNKGQVEADRERLSLLLSRLEDRFVEARVDTKGVHPLWSNMDVVSLVYQKANTAAQKAMTKTCALWGLHFLVTSRSHKHWFEYLTRVVITARQNYRGFKTIVSRDGKVIVIEASGGKLSQPTRIPFDDEDGEYITDEDFDEEGLGPNMFSVSMRAYHPPLQWEDDEEEDHQA